MCRQRPDTSCRRCDIATDGATLRVHRVTLYPDALWIRLSLVTVVGFSRSTESAQCTQSRTERPREEPVWQFCLEQAVALQFGCVTGGM